MGTVIWDDWNTNHIKKHELTVEEVTEALRDPYLLESAGYSKRKVFYGYSRKNHRLVTIIIGVDKAGLYVITARDQDKKERQKYRSNKLSLGGKNEQ